MPSRHPTVAAIPAGELEEPVHGEAGTGVGVRAEPGGRHVAVPQHALLVETAQAVDVTAVRELQRDAVLDRPVRRPSRAGANLRVLPVFAGLGGAADELDVDGP